MRGSQARLNLAFLGCGAIAARHSRTLARFHERVRCFYASRDLERAVALESRFRGAGSYGSYEAALADGRIDVVLVATPPDSHLRLTLEALRNGKDVIVEKPAFLRAADCDRVAAVQAETGRRVLVAENYCYKPLAASLRSVLGSDDIGEVRFVQVNAVKSRVRDDWRNDPGTAGGGALLEGGIHWIDFIANIGPKVRSAHGFRCGDPRALERSMVVVVEYEGGGVGTLFHSWEIGSPLQGLRISRIYGTAGSVAFESNGLFVAVYGRRQRFLVPGLRDIAGYHAMFQDFLDALESGRAPGMTLERARRDLELVEAAYSEERRAS